ncbi:MAG: sulfatase-like hydrolase/transferase [Candidatus Hydrogenedentes bacterium]|nr:sulfatase-like hydrolase/transferase [Candidatus Hydrogenedentota bacterium]
MKVTRRSFVKASAAAIAGTQAGFRSAAAGRKTQPNILLIITDQQFAGAMSCAGNRDLQTPAMDSLAAQGTRFQNAYCANPVCVPSRVSMFSGRMPHEMGVYKNIHPHPGIRNFPMLGRTLRDAGYDTGYVGKWHLLAREKEKDLHGFDYLSTNKDGETPGECAAFLNQDRDKPFFLVASFVNPHDICQWARGDALVNGEIGDAPPPEACPALPANHDIGANEPGVIRQVQAAYRERIYPTADWTDGKWRQYRWAYYRLIELVDRRIGAVLDALRQSGLEEETVVVFVSDHGDGAAAHHWNQKQVLYEEATRVPLIISQKGRTRAGVVDGTQLVSTGLDLFPTLCDFAGATPPAEIRGQSLRRIVETGERAPLRPYVVTETEFGEFTDTPPFAHTGPMGRMVRSARFKYVVYSEGEIREQLFDMEADPGEMENLAVASEHAGALADHRRMLQEWQAETRDDFPGIAPA